MTKETSVGDVIDRLTKGMGIKIPQNVEERRTNLNKKEAEHATELVMRRRYYQMLNKDSLFDDPDLKQADFSNYKAFGDEQKANKQNAREIAKEYILGQKPFNTLIVGGAGKGKTHLAISILKGVNQYMSDHHKLYGCLFIDVNEMMSRIMDCEFHHGSAQYSEYNMINLCKRANLLVLDDLGTESSMRSGTREANDMTQKVLYSILNSRNNTIVTTNLTNQQLKDVYNTKISSRIKRHLGNHIIKFTNATKDMRQGDVQW